MERWWSPEGAGTEMTSGDVALLATGSDARADLGLALFAMHRAGAAACLNAAETPLVSSQVLVDDLALARQAYAEPVIECVSKSVGSPTYAGLLVRDVADAAEHGAVDLFRAAVAKGVAPPLAAQRAALVYGVPADRLGTFRGLACTPVVPPVALQDAADRLLFGYIEAVVEDEMAALEVAKADYLEQHNEGQDDRGRFVALKDTTEGLAERLATTLRKPKTPEPERRERRELRERRVLRQPRQRREQPAQRRQSAREQIRNPQLRASVERLRLTPERLQAMTRDTSAREAQVEHTEELTGVMAQLPSHGHYQLLHLDEDEHPSFFLTRRDYMQLSEDAQDAGGQFRIGHVQNAASPTISVTGVSSGHAANQQSSIELFGLVSAIEEDTEQPTSIFVPDAVGFDVDHLTYEQQTALEEPERAVAEKWFEEHPQVRETSELYAQIMTQTVAIVDRTRGGVHFVYAPHGFTTVNEIRVVGDPRGEVEGGFRNRHIELDPNEVYTFTGFSETTWDERSQAIVVVHHVAPKTNDPFAKASSYLQAHHEAQNAQGQFVALDQEVRRVLSTPQRRERRERTELRTPRQRRLPPAQRAAARVQQRQAQQRPTFTREQVRRLSELAPGASFAKGDYLTLSGHEFAAMLETQIHGGGATPQRIHLDSQYVRDLRDSAGMDNDELRNKIIEEHRDHAVDAFESGNTVWLSDEHDIDIHRGEDIERGVLRHVAAYFALHPHINELAVEQVESPSSEFVRVEIYGVKNEHPPVVVKNEVEDWDAPVVMVHQPQLKAQEGYMSTTPTQSRKDVEQYGGDKITMLTFTRPGHTRYVLKNRSSGGSGLERG